jgi:hypothetical protein
MSKDLYPESVWVFISMKKCTKCKETKQLNNFNKDKSRKDGLSCWCKECMHINIRNNYILNKEKKNKYSKEYNKKWTNENKDHIQEYGKLYRQQNKEKIKEREKIYKEKNKHISRWRDVLKSTLKRFHRNKTASTQTLLGYSAYQLKEHLDNQNMDWENDHIDHIIPLSWFKKNTPIHIVNDLKNLQPLSSKENLEKSNKLGIIKDHSYINDIEKYIKNKLWTQLSLKNKL